MSAIDGAGELLGGSRQPCLTASEPFIDVMARTCAGLGLAPGIVDFEEIDKAYEESARERAAEGVERTQRAGLNAQPIPEPGIRPSRKRSWERPTGSELGRPSSYARGSQGSSPCGWAAWRMPSFSTPTGP